MLVAIMKATNSSVDGMEGNFQGAWHDLFNSCTMAICIATLGSNLPLAAVSSNGHYAACLNYGSTIDVQFKAI